jgi:hypothetical protein
MWEVEVVIRRAGRLDASVIFPLRLGAPGEPPTDPAAMALLGEVEQVFDRARAWRQEEQITDGFDGLVLIDSEFMRPDRLRARTQDGGETVIIGGTQYQRSGGGGAWQQLPLRRPFVAAFPYLAADAARGVVLGRPATCDGEACRIVLWESEGRSAMFAATVGMQTKRLHRLLMVAPAHYMTVRVRDIDADIRIEPPQP